MVEVLMIATGTLLAGLTYEIRRCIARGRP